MLPDISNRHIDTNSKNQAFFPERTYPSKEIPKNTSILKSGPPNIKFSEGIPLMSLVCWGNRIN